MKFGRCSTSIILIASLFASLGSIGSATAQCIDYRGYLHWIGSVDTPGWAYGVVISGTYAYIADDSAGLQVIDISNPTSPQIVGSMITPGQAYAVAILGNLACIADYDEGLLVLDITNPASPQFLSNLDTPGYAYSVAFSGELACVADGWAGLQLYSA